MDDLDSLLGELVEAKVRSSGDAPPSRVSMGTQTTRASVAPAAPVTRSSMAPSSTGNFDEYLAPSAAPLPEYSPPPAAHRQVSYDDPPAARASTGASVAPEVDDLLSQLETASVRQNRFTMSPAMLAAQGGLPQALSNIEAEIGMTSAPAKQHASQQQHQQQRVTVNNNNVASPVRASTTAQYAQTSPSAAPYTPIAAPQYVPQPTPVNSAPEHRAEEIFATLPSTASTAQRAQITRVAQPQRIEIASSSSATPTAGSADYLAAPAQRVQASDVFYAKKEQQAAQTAPKAQMTRAQQIVIEDVKPTNRSSLSDQSQLMGLNKTDPKNSTFSNYVEPPKPEHQIEDPRDYQVNAVVKKLIQTIQGQNAQLATTALKSVPMLAKSQPNLNSMKKAGLVGILIQQVQTSSVEGVPDFAGKAIDGLLTQDPAGTLAEVDRAGGVDLLINLSRSSNPAVAMQGLKLLGRYAKQSNDSTKRSIADRCMPLLAGYVRASPTPAVQHQSVVALYHIFEAVGTHQMFVERDLAAPMLKMLKENPGTQSWVLGTIGRLSVTPAAYSTIVAGGLKEAIDELFLSRSPVIANIAVSLHAASDLRVALIQADKQLQLKDD